VSQKRNIKPDFSLRQALVSHPADGYYLVYLQGRIRCKRTRQVFGAVFRGCAFLLSPSFALWFLLFSLLDVDRVPTFLAPNDFKAMLFVHLQQFERPSVALRIFGRFVALHGKS
jgi:hypothetical protein